MQKATSNSDLAFVECAQSGEAGAFDYLVLRHRADLLRLLAQHAPDRAQAEHIAEETFRRAYRALAGFPHKVHFFTWLSRIAIDTAERARAARGLPSRDEAGDPAVEELTEEMRTTVRATLANLPRDQRAALLMREHDGLTYEEIAAVLERPVATVRSFVYLARTAIDERLRARGAGARRFRSVSRRDPESRGPILICVSADCPVSDNSIETVRIRTVAGPNINQRGDAPER